MILEGLKPQKDNFIIRLKFIYDAEVTALITSGMQQRRDPFVDFKLRVV